jgi:hypothetical protein
MRNKKIVCGTIMTIKNEQKIPSAEQTMKTKGTQISAVEQIRTA